MGFHDDDTQILPALTDGEIHEARVVVEKKTNPSQVARNNLVQCDFATAEARIMAMYTPPFAAHKAVVIHDSVDYTAAESEYAVWVVADSNMIPYWSDVNNQVTEQMAHAAALQVTELFTSSDLSK